MTDTLTEHLGNRVDCEKDRPEQCLCRGHTASRRDPCDAHRREDRTLFQVSQPRNGVPRELDRSLGRERRETRRCSGSHRCTLGIPQWKHCIGFQIHRGRSAAMLVVHDARLNPVRSHHGHSPRALNASKTFTAAAGKWETLRRAGSIEILRRCERTLVFRVSKLGRGSPGSVTPHRREGRA